MSGLDRDKLARLLDRLAATGSTPAAGTLSRIARLEAAIVATETLLDDAAERPMDPV